MLNTVFIKYCQIFVLISVYGRKMAVKLRILDLADVLAGLKEITDPYQLGIQLDIDTSILKKIENDYPGKTDRQKSEVIEYWLRNSQDASWTALADAVERIGGHANLVSALRGYGEQNEATKDLKQNDEDSLELDIEDPFLKNCGMHRSRSFPLNVEERDILLLGKKGHGKSTIRCKISDCNKSGFDNKGDAQTHKSSALRRSVTERKHFRFNVYDNDGLFEGTSSVATLSSDIPKDLNLVIFVLKHGRRFDERAKKIIESIVNKWNIHDISAVVLTHCESLSEEDREKAIEQFRNDHPSVTASVGKGILAVGFPNNSLVRTGSQLSQRVEDDKKKLRQLIYSCDEKVTLPQARSWTRCSIS